MKDNFSARKGRDSGFGGPKTATYKPGGFSSRPKTGGFSSRSAKPFSSNGRGSSSYDREPSATSSYGAPRSSSYPASSYSSAPRVSAGSSRYGGFDSGRPSFPGKSFGGGSSSYGGGRSFGGQRGGFGGGSRFGQGGGSSYGGSRFGGGNRFGGNRGRGGRSGGANPHMVEGFDTRKFVNKVDPNAVVDTAVAYQNKHTFNDFKIEQVIKDRIGHKGFVTPSPIQDSAIPPILEGKDVVGIANTGTGKTAAFLIPLINKVMLDPNQQVLILAPTRELAIQIEEELHIFIKGTKIFSVCCVGGANIRRQISELRYFNNFIIGTPGRIKDLIDRKFIKLAEFNTIVLDEADRMLDMGFIDDVRFMVTRMPKERHTLFFTATMSKEIERLIHEFLNNPVTISVKTGDTSKNVDQDVVRTASGKTKFETLHDLLSQPEFTKVLVFGKTKHGVEKLTGELVAAGHKAGSIHGDKNHFERQRTLKMFKDEKINFLVATDVAARGLDIPNVTHVINYELPSTYEDYVHRIGRTGRGGKHGKALTFIGR